MKCNKQSARRTGGEINIGQVMQNRGKLERRQREEKRVRRERELCYCVKNAEKRAAGEGDKGIRERRKGM